MPQVTELGLACARVGSSFGHQIRSVGRVMRCVRGLSRTRLGLCAAER